MYHVYHYWKQSVDDIFSPALTAWVNDVLGLSFLASKIKEISYIEPFSERMLGFLSLIEYFSDSELAELIPAFERWEKRLEWETYKERADALVEKGEPSKAISLYRRALQYEENIRLLNNISVAYMQLEFCEEACNYLERALELHNNKTDETYHDLLLHYTEALISAGKYRDAAEVLSLTDDLLINKKNSHHSYNADILYLRGELALKTGYADEAAALFTQAIELNKINHYIFRLADVYSGRRQYERAINVLLNYIPKIENNLSALIKTAELYELSDNLPAAINSLNKAAELKPNEADVWIKLAGYHRKNYDPKNAETAINKALSIDSGNARARLESAKIQKNIGRTKVYQELLKGILSDFKADYREAL